MANEVDPTHLALYKAQMLALGVELARSRIADIAELSIDDVELDDRTRAVATEAKERAAFLLRPLDDLADSLRASHVALVPHGLPTLEQLQEVEDSFSEMMRDELELAELEREEAERLASIARGGGVASLGVAVPNVERENEGMLDDLDSRVVPPVTRRE